MPVGEAYKLSTDDELLFRQVIEIWIQEGRPARRAFEPNTGDSGHLSCDRSSVVTPREAFEAYLAGGRKSGGVWAVSVGECVAAAVHSYSDPLQVNPAHAIVDYSPFPAKDWRKISIKLHAHAVSRGRQHPAEDAA